MIDVIFFMILQAFSHLLNEGIFSVAFITKIKSKNQKRTNGIKLIIKNGHQQTK